MPSYFSLIFDIKYHPQTQRVVYLETGAAPCSVIEAVVLEKVWQDIAAQFPGQTIYMSEPLPLPPDAQLRGKIEHVPDLINQLLQQKITHGVFLFDSTVDSQTAYHFKRHHGAANIHIINPDATLFCNNKMPFYDLCERAQIPYPKTWFMSNATFAAQKNTLPAKLEHGWIVKPPNSSKGNGTAYVDDLMLPKVLAFLNDRKQPNPLINECRFTYFWGSQNQNQQKWPYLLQEMVSAKNKAGVETTFRIVVSMTTDEMGRILSFKNLGVIEKSPVPMKKKCSASVISLTNEVAQEYQYKENFIRVLTSQDVEHLAIENIVRADMQRLMPQLTQGNHSAIWCRHIGDVTQNNDYLSYLMPRIELGNFDGTDEYNHPIFEKIKEIIVNGSPANRKLLLQLFKNRYFGEENKFLPNWSRHKDLFFCILCFILTEKEKDNLSMIWGMAEFCLNDTQLNSDDRMRISHIQTLAGNKLAAVRPEIFTAASLATCFYGPYACFGYFPEKVLDAAALTAEPIAVNYRADKMDIKC